MESTNGIQASVAKLSLDDQHRLAEILALKMYAWVIGNPMYSGENQSFVESFRFLAPFVQTKRKRNLRLLYRGVRIDVIPSEWADGSARQAITSLKPLQSWSGKVSVAREFTDGNKQDWTKGKHGVVFAARASALPILFTMIDLRDCYWDLVEGLSPEAKDQWTSMSHSEFSGVYSELEGYAKQDEVIVLGAPSALMSITGVSVLQ